MQYLDFFEEEDLYLFRVAHSDALSTAINWGPDKN